MDYNVSEIFQQVFGVAVNSVYVPLDKKPQGINDGSNVIVNDEASNMPKLNYSGIEIIKDEEEAKAMSALGTPILLVSMGESDSCPGGANHNFQLLLQLLHTKYMGPPYKIYPLIYRELIAQASQIHMTPIQVQAI